MENLSKNSTKSTSAISPGTRLKMFLENKNLNMTESAKLLGISQQLISQIVNDKRDISINTCQRIAIVFNENPEKWALIQARYNLAVTQETISKLGLQPYKNKP